MDSKLDLILQEGRNTRKIVEENHKALKMLAQAVGANGRAIDSNAKAISEVKTIALKNQD